jgi:hypothetical protein
MGSIWSFIMCDFNEEESGKDNYIRVSQKCAESMKETVDRRATNHLFQNIVYENFENDIRDYYEVRLYDGCSQFR